MSCLLSDGRALRGRTAGTIDRDAAEARSAPLLASRSRAPRPEADPPDRPGRRDPDVARLRAGSSSSCSGSSSSAAAAPRPEDQVLDDAKARVRAASRTTRTPGRSWRPPTPARTRPARRSRPPRRRSPSRPDDLRRVQTLVSLQLPGGRHRGGGHDAPGRSPPRTPRNAEAFLQLGQHRRAGGPHRPGAAGVPALPAARSRTTGWRPACGPSSRSSAAAPGAGTTPTGARGPVGRGLC